MKNFVNLSNHPSSRWDAAQLKAAEAAYGPVVDFPFPAVDPHADKAEVSLLADGIVAQVLAQDPAAIMCQGEMTLVYALVAGFKAAGIPVVAACSERRVDEPEPGKKISVFEFVQFREY